MTHWRERFEGRKAELHTTYASYEDGNVDEARVKYKLAKLMHTTWQHYDGHK